MWARLKTYIKAHADHFLISIGVSLSITIIVNVIMHYLPWILAHLHVPAFVIRLITK
jgi:hypothetical protein